MLAAKLYETVYLFILTILTVIISYNYSTYSNDRFSIEFKQNPIPAFVLSILMALFIGLRPQSGWFTDMTNYMASYARWSMEDYFVFEWDTENKLFDNYEHYLAINGYDITVFFLSIAILYFGGMFVAFKKMFPKDILYMLVIYMSAFSTFSYGTNGIKAGAAASLFLCALAYTDKKIIMALFLALSLGFHHSMVVPITAIIIAHFYKNTHAYYLLWFVCVLIALCHITIFQELFNSFADEGGQDYLSAIDGEANHGFRPDFIFYSAFPVVIGYYAVFRKGYYSRRYELILNTYLIVNSVWLLCMYAQFPNRIAYLSWQFLPIAMFYPFFDKEFIPNQYRKLNLVAWFHLGFTMFMNVVYYGMLKKR